MSCCLPYIESFYNKSSTTISYPAALKALYGNYPKVQVIYYDPEAGEYYVSNNFTRSVFTGDAIVVDHGGNATGLIKVY